MKKVIIILFAVLSRELYAQVQLTPVLVGSAGNYSTWSGGSLSASVGEPVISTFSSSSNFLTQGFQQPRMVQELRVGVRIKNATCTGSDDGYAVAKLTGGVPPYTYQWTPNVGMTDSIAGLTAGDYTVIITDFYNRSAIHSFTIGTDFIGDCKFKFYGGITPNGDGKNDHWDIEGIEFYPDNNVLIFNRWGDKVWENKGYNNIDIVWAGINKEGLDLPDGTYFYVVTLNNNVLKGWIELIR